MNFPQFFFQAVLNRLVSRLNSHITDTAVNTAILIQEVPEKAIQQWELFYEEVQLEAQRIEKNKIGNFNHQSRHSENKKTNYTLDIAQTKIDDLRIQVSILVDQIEEFSQ